MVVEAKNYLTAPIEWSLGEDPEYPYEAGYEGHKLFVRLNDFPEEELYALIADGEEITNFDDWPNSWTRPSVSTTTSDHHDVDETDVESISRLFDLYGSQTLSRIKVLLRIRGCVQPTEHSLDVAEFVWIHALENLDSLNSPETFPSWLYTIARHHSIAHLRQCTKRPGEPEHYEAELTHQILIRAESIDKPLFQLLDLYFKGFTAQEICERLGKSLNNLRTLKALLKETKE